VKHLLSMRKFAGDRKMTFVWNGRLHVATVLLSAVVLTACVWPRSSSASQPPSGLVLIQSTRTLVGYRLDGTEAFQVSTARAVSLSPDARLLAYEADRGRRATIRVRSLIGASDRKVATIPWSARFLPTLTWAPNGRAIAAGYRPRDCSSVPAAAVILRVFFTDGRSQLVVHGTPTGRYPGAPLTIEVLGWAPDSGQLLFTVTTRFVEEGGDGECGAGGPSTLYVLDMGSGQSRAIAHSKLSIAYAQFAPDGRNVLYLDGSDFGGVSYVVRTDDLRRRRLAKEAVDSAVFSPDGRKVALLLRPGDGKIHLVVARSDGMRRRQVAAVPVGSPTVLFWTSTWHIIALLHGRLIVTDLRPAVQQRLHEIPLGRCATVWPSDTGSAIAIAPNVGVRGCFDERREPAPILVVSLRSGRRWTFDMGSALNRSGFEAVRLQLP
jgi:dipeptidyl aminopeptidase/acylaminoacyl peptidase